uniref:CD36 family protein n=1 Tax=Rhabditophanes sp. KR3021 TaxID=114890 RepID=A0AC35TMD6_9BILA
MWPNSKWGKIIFFGILALLFVIGLILLIPMPLAIFPAILRGQLQLGTDESGQYATLTNYWWKLPSHNYYDYVLWNITNPDSVNFMGAKASVQAVGPYSYKESEIKDYINWKDNGEKVYYRNEKTWIYSQETSCEKCDWEDSLYLPNLVFMTNVKYLEEYNVQGLKRLVMDASLLLLGEYPIKKVTQRGILFESYEDPMINLLNSGLMSVILNITGPNLFGFPIPDIKAVGYFPMYNHTSDEDYVSWTGKDKSEKLNQISQWSNSTQLPFWNTSYANNLEDKVFDGTFNGAFIKDDEPMKQFQSFACRHFELVSTEDVTVSDIPGRRWKMIDDNMNPYVDRMKAYEYQNYEKANYFPDWPCGSKQLRNDSSCGTIDCHDHLNFCSTCCENENKINGTYKLPNGFMPLACFPGLNKKLPFHASLSSHHFVLSPKEVSDSIIGLSPNYELHNLGHFEIQPTVGSTLSAVFRIQFNIPIWNSKTVTQLWQFRSTHFPCFSLSVNAHLKDYAYNFIRLATKTAPLIILILGIILVALPLLILAIWFIFKKVYNDKQKKSLEEHDPVSHEEAYEEN